jgi:tetratricopeptide (TPR) repeat protein
MIQVKKNAMKIWQRTPIFVATLVLMVFCCTGGAFAVDESPTIAPPKVTLPQSPMASFWDKLEQLRGDRQLQELVEEDLEKSIVIRGQIQEEVDRAFNHTTTLINVLLGILTFLPVLIAVSVWFIRRSVIHQIVSETKQQLKTEVEKQFEQEIATELKEQATAFKQEIENLRTEFLDQLIHLKDLISDTQKKKDLIIQELAQITPSPIRESTSPETQEKIQALTKELELLSSGNAQLQFTANDYVEQGKAFHVEGRFEDAQNCYEKAIQLEPDNAKAWFGNATTLTKLQQIEAAIAAYEHAIQLKPDFPEAWFGKGTVLGKLQKLEDAILAYDQATQLKPDFFLAWFAKARCYALQNDLVLALESLKQAIHLNGDKLKEAVKADASFDALRTYEPFKQLMEG